MSKKTGAIIGIVMAGVAIFSVFFMKWGKKVEDQVAAVRPLKTFVVTDKRADVTYTYLGTVEAAEKADASFEVAGRLRRLLVKKGEEVKKGQLLAELDSRDFKNAVDAARASSIKANDTVKRFRVGAKTGAVTKQQLADAEAAAIAADADLKIREKALADTKLYADFDGVIADLLVDNYENVGAKQKIAVLQGRTNLDIVADIPESRLAKIDRKARRAGKNLSLFTAKFDYFEKTYPVTLKEFTTQADRVTHTYKATFTMPRPAEAVLPGMPATIIETEKVGSDNTKGLLVPVDVVPVDPVGKYFVWVLGNETNGIYQVEKREVEVGQLMGDSIIVKSGLKAGERIAAAGVHILLEGQKVTLFNDKGAAKK